LAARCFMLKRADLVFAFLDRALVAFRIPEFNQRHSILDLAFKPRDRAETIFEIGPLTHDFLRGFGIIPEFRMFGLRVQFRETLGGSVEVKDASSAVRRTAWWIRADSQFQRA
jgi:hypothetical protein